MSEAELERLALLSEELGEVQQIVGKIIRHGYSSYSPLDESKTTNRKLLEKELGDVLFAANLMIANNDISQTVIQNRSHYKRDTIQKYLHHNTV